ncbi:hypothetical protein WR25_14026 [Diploscapter pachys]|uniref:Chitinase domain-containing protein 1 n=1 Tax=Diploscapter pachys TaxID=2018661 RepID=A0A2A2KVD1_9BILA|nr:hypothetical protein WR25_14026 [Diploscapter pachys]
MKWLIICALIGLSLELGKSDKKKKVVEEEAPEQTLPEAADESDLNPEVLKSLKHPPKTVTKESILKEHEELDRGEKQFKGPLLAYITPWNGHGYDMAKWTAKKLTHISPVWLQAKPSEDEGNVACTIAGTHDIDRGWMEELRHNNPDIKIVPRILFEGWTLDIVQKFLQDESWTTRCARNIAEFLSRNQFEGAVIEAWMQILTVARSREAIFLLHEALETLSKAMKKHELLVFYAVGPPLRDVGEPTGILEPEDFKKLASHADFVQIMTYDYMSQKPAGVAPIPWVAASIDYLLTEQLELKHKLLIGLNYYGYEYSKSGMEPVKYDKFLGFIKQQDSVLEWDPQAMEHRVRGKEFIVYYPSTTSLEMRLKVADSRGVGCAIWEYGQGLQYFSKVL